MLVRSSPRAPSFLKHCKVFGDPPGTHSRAENSGDLRCGVGGGEAGEGRGFFSGCQLRGWCAGWGVRSAATKSAFTERQRSIEALGDRVWGGRTGEGAAPRCLL